MTHRFDPGADGEGYSATLRVTGRRLVRGTPRAGDSFVHEEEVGPIVPGAGPITFSTWVYGLSSGEWDVDATLRRHPTRVAAGTAHDGGTERLARATWSWRHWAVEAAPSTPIRTRGALLAPLARIPGVQPGAFTALAVLAIVAALAVQSAIGASAGLPVGPTLLVSLVGMVSGLIGAKIWSRVLHPGEAIVGPGWAVDGFLVVAPAVAIVLLLALRLPVGTYLDATAPGLFLAVAIGRLGCFVTGCCAGRPTRHRWGIWSSDRRIGARRLPAQLIESAAGVGLGLVALVLVLGPSSGLPGATFALTAVAYLVVRTGLLRLRAEPRSYLWRRAASVPRPA